MTAATPYILRLLLPILCVIIGTTSTHAQVPAYSSPTPAATNIAPAPEQITPPFSGIILNDEVSTLLQNNFYVIPDPGKSLSNKTIAEKIVSGTFRKHLSPSSVIHLGQSGATVWIVIPLTNVSNSDVWELDFGDMASGRRNFLSRLSVYNGFNSKTIYDSSPQGQPSYSIPNIIHLNIPVGQSNFVIIETRSPAGSIGILNLSLKKSYQANTSISFSSVLMARLPLIAVAILLTVFAVQRRVAYGAFALAWLLIYLHSYLINHYTFLNGIPPQLLTPVMWLLASLLLIGGFWASEDEEHALPPSLYAGLGFLSLICGLIGLFLASFVPFIGSLLSFGPLLIATLLIIALGVLHAIRNRDLSYLFLAFSGFLILSSSSVILASSYLLLNNALLLASSQVLLCLAAASCAIYGLLGSQDYVAMPDTDSISPIIPVKDLSEAKENSEHKRLLQVLEQERATMGEMQVQEARRTEEMRKAKETADEANNAKSAFLAVVSHEIRTPMTGIMGMVRLILDTALSKDQKEYALTIQDSGEALMALLNDILDFEKIESGKLELERADFDLPRLVRGVQTLMNGHANSKGVDLKLELDSKVPSFVTGDSTRLRQILLNLVNNAIKFTPAKGTVYIRINDLTPDDKLQGPHQIYFAVQDSGIGISPEIQKKLFMPFAQADSSTARKYGGTGLGLAICKRLIEVMGGAINISSKSGEGATFFFTLSLPLGHGDSILSNFSGSASTTSLAEHPPIKAETPSLRILVVDDNGINQKVLTGLIEKEGHIVTTASTGAEALSKYLAAKYDLVLMDIELPDRNGLDVTSDIRNLRDLSKASVPIVAMTGNTSENDVAACFNVGMDDFLAKPINPERLKKMLTVTAGHGSFANQAKKVLLQTKREQNAPLDTYVPVPPPATGEDMPYIPQPPPKALPETPAFSFDLDGNEDEDTFASAIERFEAIEAQSVTLDSDLDETMLTTLKDSLTKEQFEELLVSFYEKAEELVTAIGQAYLHKDMEILGARSHELKGMSGNFGFKGVSALSAQIEKAAKAKIEVDLKIPVEHLAETYAVSKARLASWQEQ